MLTTPVATPRSLRTAAQVYLKKAGGELVGPPAAIPGWRPRIGAIEDLEKAQRALAPPQAAIAAAVPSSSVEKPLTSSSQPQSDVSLCTRNEIAGELAADVVTTMFQETNITVSNLLGHSPD